MPDVLLLQAELAECVVLSKGRALAALWFICRFSVSPPVADKTSVVQATDVLYDNPFLS